MSEKAFTGERKDALPPLNEIFRPVSEDLAEMESCLARELESPHAFMRQYTDHLSRYRGKRLRPAVLFLAARAVGNVDRRHVAVAAAAELMHCATLVHDDILDEAQKRRGMETANVRWGNERSVLLGDYVFTRAFEIVQRQGVDELLADLIASAQEICLGEMLQIEKRYDFTVDEPFYLSMIGMKTASLFRFCAGAGARLAGGTASHVEALRTFAGNLGIAFQIIDDCLDLVGDEQVVGKSLGTDIEKGKMTLPLIYAWSRTSGRERDALERIFREGDRSVALFAILDEHKALDYAMHRAVEYVEEGRKALATLPLSPALEHASAVGDFVLSRRW
jgi:octaprenyl-diphosphate synthase